MRWVKFDVLHIARIPFDQMFNSANGIHASSNRMPSECDGCIRAIHQCNRVHQSMLKFFHHSIVKVVEHSSCSTERINKKRTTGLVDRRFGKISGVRYIYLKTVDVCIAVVFRLHAISSVREDPVIGVQLCLCCFRCCWCDHSHVFAVPTMEKKEQKEKNRTQIPSKRR